MPIVVQIFGSALVLAGFIGLQVDRMTATSLLYLALNVIGSVALAWSAIVESQWGFLVLEAIWTGASVLGLYRAFRRRPSLGAGHT
jgi:uncharacterized membrane protein